MQINNFSIALRIEKKITIIKSTTVIIHAMENKAKYRTQSNKQASDLILRKFCLLLLSKALIIILIKTINK